MPLRITFKAAFQKAFDNLPPKKQTLALETLEEVRAYLANQDAPYGLRTKKLYDQTSQKVFEARVSEDLRLVWIQTKEEAIFALIANHNEIKKFLKNL